MERREIEAKLRAVFREEAAELLDELRVILERLRSGEPGTVAVQLAHGMRAAHNLKGAAGNVGLVAIQEAAHTVEDALLALREASPTVRMEGLGLVREVVAAIEVAAESSADEPRIDGLSGLSSWLGRREPGRADEESEQARADAEALRTNLRAADEPPRASSPQSDRTHGALPTSVATVRVRVDRLDRLMGFASELLVTGTDMKRRHVAFEELRELLDGAARVVDVRAPVQAAVRALDRLIQDHERAVSSFSRLAGDLHDAMKRTRMVSLESLAPALRRTVDDAARTLGKDVELELALSGIEVDRSVLDGVRDPLVHLLRNAVDHGLEASETRAVLGKPARSLVRVSAEVRGPTVSIVVADDGRGLDPERIAAVLVARGLVTERAAAEMGDEALIDQLFAEGFSTRDRATNLSGRGVGLDVVRRALTALGGDVRAESRGPLGGAAFVLTVPLSVLSTSLLLVRADEHSYAVPSRDVLRVLRVSRQAVRWLDGSPVIDVGDGEPLPLCWLAQAYGGRPPREGEVNRVLVLAHGRARVALAVDEVLREEELVVSRLPWNLSSVEGVSGAVVLSDGSISVVVDTAHLVAGRHSAPIARANAPRSAQAKVLVVDDSLTTRALHRSVLEAAGHEVVLAHDGNEAWERLKHEQVEAVVSDVQMPGMDGFELARRIRAEPRLSGLVVVLVTSLARPEDMQRGIEVGADEYVVKGPLEQDALLAAVTRHLGGA